MVCYQRALAEKILMSWDKKILVQIIIDDMDCAELERTVKENE